MRLLNLNSVNVCFIVERAVSGYYFTMVRTSKTEKGSYLLAWF